MTLRLSGVLARIRGIRPSRAEDKGPLLRGIVANPSDRGKVLGPRGHSTWMARRSHGDKALGKDRSARVGLALADPGLVDNRDGHGRERRDNPRPSVISTLAVSVSLVFGLVLFIVPLHQTQVTVISRFGYDLNATSARAMGGYFALQFIVPPAFCPPEAAAPNATVSFVWEVASGQNVTMLLVVDAVLPPPGHDLVFYQATNASLGGYSFISQYPFPCGYEMALVTNTQTPQVVHLTGFLEYQITRYVPLL